jgi:predicted outer membrane repeat protein
VYGATVTMAWGMVIAGAVAVPARADTNVGCAESDLRTAIDASNSTPGGDTLILTSYCVYSLTDAGGGVLPQLTQPLVIQGNNATIRRDPSATAFRLFQVTTGGSLTMDTLTLMNGDYSPGDLGGGAVAVTQAGGPLTTTNVNFQGNTASGRGGAIYIDTTSTATSSITGGTISDNSSGLGGGGIYSERGQVALDSTTITRNRSEFGGGLYGEGTALTVDDSTISNNTGIFGGGGLYLSSGGATTPVNITNTRVTGNTVSRGDEGGGGITLFQGNGHVATITDSTIAGNTLTGFTNTDGAANSGGGINKETGSSGTLVLDNTRVTGNRVIGAGGQGAGIGAFGGSPAATLTLRNGTVVTGNLASGRYSRGGGIYTGNGSGTLTVAIEDSSVDTNKVSGTGASAAGLYNDDATVTLDTSSVSNNIAPLAPAPGGISTGVDITSVTSTTITGNTPTNCLLSPATVTNCIG